MAKLNLCIQYGMINDKPIIKRNPETGEPVAATVYIHLLRGYRDVHDGKMYSKHDHPLIMSLDSKIAKEMSTWGPYDIVMIKGALSTKLITKTSSCVHCKDENDKPSTNTHKGILLYVTPIFAQKIRSCKNKTEAREVLLKSKEVSNLVEVAGTLVKDPVTVKTKAGIVVTQYPIALNRKFRIKEDAPEIKTDYPWVKSYGEQAIEDKMRLKLGSNIVVDGFMQTRVVIRKTRCKHCLKIYEWEDTSMELVPYDTEYIWGTYLTDDDLEKEKNISAEDLRQQIFDELNISSLTVPEDYNSEDIDPSKIK